MVLLGYIFMHFSFVTLFINMRTLGSSFWLRKSLPLVFTRLTYESQIGPIRQYEARTDTAAFATLISSTFAFLVALLSAYLLNIPIDPVSLSEALPFLVITVGFDKPFRLAQAVFTNPDIHPTAASPEMSPIEFSSDTLGVNALDLNLLHKELAPLERLQKLAENRGARWAAPVAAKKIVVDAVKDTGVSVVRDYGIEIAVLSLGALSGIGGLREFCYLGTSISRS